MYGGHHRRACRPLRRLVAQTGSPTAAAERAERAQRASCSARSPTQRAGDAQPGRRRGRPRRAGGQPRGRCLVRAGLVERPPDPDNRRRLALRLTEAGRDASSSIAAERRHRRSKPRLERLAHSELRAIERAIEILERLPVDRAALRMLRCSMAAICG